MAAASVAISCQVQFLEHIYILLHIILMYHTETIQEETISFFHCYIYIFIIYNVL